MKARLRLPWLFVGCVLAFANQTVASGAPDKPNSQGNAHVDRALKKIARETPQASVRVIVQGQRGADAEDAIRTADGQVHARLPQVGGVAAELPAGRIAELAQQSGIKRIAVDPPIRPVDAPTTALPASVFNTSIGAPRVWATGVTGRGLSIAVLDSGVHPHPDFGHPSRVVHDARFNHAATAMGDNFGHGTWVAGIAAGDGTASDGRYQGVAPHASIVNLKVTNDIGAAYTSDVVQALGWVAANAKRYHIHVVNLSFVSSVQESYLTSLLDAAVEMVWHAGVVVVVSAGNKGPGGVGYAPANDPYVITVGATDDKGTSSVRDDTLAWFSSFGITPDKVQKPDLVAPGRHIIGTLASSRATLAQEYPRKVIDERYIQLSGTSASAPVVSGAATLLLQARPTLKPDEVKWLLTRTARPMPGVTGAGSGALDIEAAIALRGRLARANRGLIPNHLVALAYLSQRGEERDANDTHTRDSAHRKPSTEDGAVSWDSVSWDSVSWDSVSWDSVSWDSVSWDSVSWDSVSWDSVSWDSVSWDSVIGTD